MRASSSASSIALSPKASLVEKMEVLQVASMHAGKFF